MKCISFRHDSVNIYCAATNCITMHVKILIFTELQCKGLYFNAHHYAVQCSALQYRYSAVQCSAVQYSTVQYDAAQCSTVLCSADNAAESSSVPYGKLQCSALPRPQ